MSDNSIDPSTIVNSGASHDAGPSVADHRDKYNDPRVRITTRGILMGVGVFVLGVIGAAASIYARKTRLEQTTRFWGEETIIALQLGERMHLMPRGGSSFEPVELTATPGLGLLRRKLLDERNFDWSTEIDRNALESCSTASNDVPSCIQLRLTDPTAHRFDLVEIDIDLNQGWVGPSDGSRRVRASERVRPQLRNYFATIINVQQQRYDQRD